MLHDICVFSGTTAERLATTICNNLSIPLSNRKLKPFKDGELDVQLLENVRGKDVFIINPTCPPSSNKDELTLLADAARDSSAGRITLVIPYLGYNRQDRKSASRTPVSAWHMIQEIKICGADHALLLDVHSEPTVVHFKPNMTTDHLYGSWTAVPYIRELLAGKDFSVASPDAGGVSRMRKYAQHLARRRLAVFLKLRSGANEIAEDETIAVGDIDGYDIIFVDDIMDTFGTMDSNGKLAKSLGAKDLYAFATHGLFSGNAMEKIANGPFKEIITTDSVCNLEPGSRMIGNTKLTVLSVAPLLSTAIQRLHHDKSLSDLIIA
jgi:ribose-phosphate pyrophosphokinase